MKLGGMVLGVIACLGSAVEADESLAGKRVVVIREQAPLEVSGKEVAKASECSVFTVTSVQGTFLWIETEKAYLRRSDVVALEDAIDHYTLQLEANKTARSYWNRASIWRLKGELDIAIGDMNEALRLSPNDSNGFFFRGCLWSDKKEHDKAIADFSEAIRLDPKHAMAYHNRGNAWRIKKDFDSAIADYDQGLKLTDSNDINGPLAEDELSGGDSGVMVRSRALMLTGRGIAWKNKGEYEKALADFDDAIRLDRRNQDFRHNRLLHFEELGAWDAVIADCNENIRVNPKNFAAWTWLRRAEAHLNKFEYEKALTDYEEAIRLYPNDESLRNKRRAVWVKLQSWDKIIADCDEAIPLNPKDANLIALRGVAYLNKFELDKALIDFDEAIRLEPTAKLPRNSRLIIWQEKNAWDEIISECDALIRMYPTEVFLLTYRGTAHLKKSDYVRALADFDEALRLDPNEADSRAKRREIWEKQRAWAKVIADWESVLRKGTPSPASYRGLAWVLATCPDERYRNGPMAVEYATSACELIAWKEAQNLDTLAAAYAEVGDFNKAVKWQQKAINLAPAEAKADLETRLKLYENETPYRQPAP